MHQCDACYGSGGKLPNGLSSIVIAGQAAAAAAAARSSRDAPPALLPAATTVDSMQESPSLQPVAAPLSPRRPPQSSPLKIEENEVQRPPDESFA